MVSTFMISTFLKRCEPNLKLSFGTYSRLLSTAPAPSASDIEIQKALDEWKTDLSKYEKVEAETLSPTVVSAAQATFDAPGVKDLLKEGDVVPLMWSLFTFQPKLRHDMLKIDGTGQPKYLAISPPSISNLTERMWASGSFDWNQNNPLRVGEQIKRTTSIDKVEKKVGREGRGDMYFVWQKMLYENLNGPSIVEKRCHVFRKPAPTTPPPTTLLSQDRSSNKKSLPEPRYTPDQANFCINWIPSTVLLFRYSALIFDSHRIHYDTEFVQKVQNRPGLVVTGPLTVNIMCDLVQNHLIEKFPNLRLKYLEYKATNPLYASVPACILGKWVENGKINIWAINDQGTLCMDAYAIVENI